MSVFEAFRAFLGPVIDASRGRRPRLLGVMGLILGVLVTPGTASACDASGDGDPGSVVAGVAALLAGAGNETAEEDARRVLRPGGELAITTLLRVLVQGTDSRTHPLSARQRGALVRALADFADAGLWPVVGAALGEAPEPAVATAALAIVEGAGSTEQLSLVLLCARSADGPDEGAPEATREIDAALTDALVAIAGQDAHLWPMLADLWSGLSAPTRRGVVRAAAVARDPLCVAVLKHALADEASLRGPALAAASRIATSVEPGSRDELLRLVRPALRDESPTARQSAAVTLARLADVHSVPDLIELLGDAHPGVRTSAHWSLRRLTGVALRPDAGRWEAWYAEQSTWHRDVRPGVVGDLLSSDAATAIEAVRLLAGRPLFRAETAHALSTALASRHVEVRRAACTALAALGERSSAPDLVALLDDADARVRAAAHEALVALTGLELSADRPAWDRELARDAEQR